jgi:hypothetical protein
MDKKDRKKRKLKKRKEKRIPVGAKFSAPIQTALGAIQPRI